MLNLLRGKFQALPLLLLQPANKTHSRSGYHSNAQAIPEFTESLTQDDPSVQDLLQIQTPAASLTSPHPRLLHFFSMFVSAQAMNARRVFCCSSNHRLPASVHPARTICFMLCQIRYRYHHTLTTEIRPNF